ncbi:MAG: hypothetical protein ACI840_001327 [Ulvibacter sp.]|jgi:hypothetical protein
MKFSKLFLIVLMVATIVSCSSDDDNASPNADLLGTWNATSITGSSTGTTLDSGITTSFSSTWTTSNINLTSTFTENPNNVISQGTYNSTLTIMADGQTTVSDDPDATLIDNTVSWTRSGNSLALLSDSGDAITYSMAITDNTLILTTTETITEVNGTTTTTSTDIFEASYTKQ